VPLVVFVEKESDYTGRSSASSGDATGPDRDADLSDYGRVRSLPVLALEPDGRGRCGPRSGPEPRSPPAPGGHAEPRRRLRRVGLAVVSVSWSVPEGDAVDVRVGRPRGLFSRRSPAAARRRREMVTDGTVFYLQDVSAACP